MDWQVFFLVMGLGFTFLVVPIYGVFLILKEVIESRRQYKTAYLVSLLYENDDRSKYSHYAGITFAKNKDKALQIVCADIEPQLQFKMKLVSSVVGEIHTIPDDVVLSNGKLKRYY